MTNIAPAQTLLNQQGEIAFRKYNDKSILSPNLPNFDQLVTILKSRNLVTEKIVTNFQARRLTLSPFLEIGAEYAQRSALLVNKFNLAGFALDLSLDSLISAKTLAKKLNFKKLPLLICADAYHLPFASHSLPFVFCFETLHHFPHPKPIIDECLRVSSSSFYFGEEPISQLVNLHLWRRDYHLTPLETFLKKIYLLPFLSNLGKSEVDHGILENTFWLNVWKRSLPQTSQVLIKPVFGPAAHSLNPNLLIKLLLALQGGGISTLITKQHMPTNAHHMTNGQLLKLLCCPTCRTKLRPVKLSCPKCKQHFVKKHGIYILLPEKQRKQLYGF